LQSCSTTERKNAVKHTRLDEERRKSGKTVTGLYCRHFYFSVKARNSPLVEQLVLCLPTAGHSSSLSHIHGLTVTLLCLL